MDDANMQEDAKNDSVVNQTDSSMKGSERKIDPAHGEVGPNLFKIH